MLSETNSPPNEPNRRQANRNAGKTKLTITILLGLLTFAFAANRSSVETGTAVPPSPPVVNNNISSDFLIWSMDVGKAIQQQGSEWVINYSHFQDLNFNVWHKYTMVWDWTIYQDPWNNGWTFHNFIWNDRLFTDVNQYSGAVYSKVLQPNDQHNMYTLMHRAKIEYLCYGARSDYQAEKEPEIQNRDLWYYNYTTSPDNNGTIDDITDNSQYGEGQKVKHCTYDLNIIQQGGVYILKDLYTNREQVSVNNNQYQEDRNHTWYIKPRIRIDKDYANNQQNLGKAVCKVEICDCYGNVIKTTEIHVRNFKEDQLTEYSGYYLLDYNFGFPWNDPSELEFTSTINGNEINPNNKSVYDIDFEVDYRIKWYGEVEMWIDYVRVEDNIAQDLLSNNPLNPNYVLYNQWMQQEVNLALQSSRPLKFYIEEFEFNHLSCMAEVNHKLQQYSSNLCDLMCQFAEGRFYYHIGPDAYQWTNFVQDADYVKRNLIEKCNLKQFFTATYPFVGGNNASWYKVPSTVPIGFHSYDVSQGRLANSVSPNDYEPWLQTEMDETPSHNGFRYVRNLKLADEISKSANIPYLQLVQGHMLYWGPYSQLREATNEELAMNINLAITYGARGISYFDYSAYNCVDPIQNLPGRGSVYGRGLCNPVDCTVDPADVTPRYYNVYGQNKWQKIIDMNERLKTLGQTLMSFDNTNRHSYIYRLADERIALLDNTYFQLIQAFPPNPYDLNQPLYDPEAAGSTYVQAAVFKNTEPYNKYFMIVNRRCSPYRPEINEPGGRREIIVRFDANFGRFVNWKLIDIEDGALIATLNTSTTSAGKSWMVQSR